MNDEMLSLEGELKALRPRRLTEDAERRLVQQLAEKPPRAIRYRRPLRVLAAAALLLVAISLFLLPEPPEGDQPAPAVVTATVPPTVPHEPSLPARVAVETLPLERRNEGIVFLDPTTPARQVRCGVVDRFVWKDEVTGETVQVLRPREEVLLVQLQVN